MAEYSDVELDRIIGAALGGRIARIEERLAAHTTVEEADSKSVRLALDKLHERIESRDSSLAVCKEGLKKEISESYVTRSELTIALERAQRHITDAIGGKIDDLQAQISLDKSELAKYKTTISAVIMTLTVLGGLVSWSLSNYSTTQQLQAAEDGRQAVMQQILSELRSRKP